MNWREAIRFQLRRSPAWVTFRYIQSEGWRKALKRRHLWSRILRTRPLFTDPVDQEVSVEIHLLCCANDYLCGIWALKSFYHFAGVRYPLVIHLQGSVSDRAVARLRIHFPTARIILQVEADDLVHEWLEKRGFVRLQAARRASPFMMKLTDFPILSRAVRLLTLDSDVLFFRYPKELLTATQSSALASLFQRDLVSTYNLSVERARTDLGIELAPQINTGIALFPRDSLQLARCEEYLAHHHVARPSGWIEQTLHALCASEQGRVAYLPDDYLVSLERDVHLDQVIARHYAGPSRPLLSQEGMPKLIQMGFLEQLQAR